VERKVKREKGDPPSQCLWRDKRVKKRGKKKERKEGYIKN